MLAVVAIDHLRGHAAAIATVIAALIVVGGVGSNLYTWWDLRHATPNATSRQLAATAHAHHWDRVYASYDTGVPADQLRDHGPSWVIVQCDPRSGVQLRQWNNDQATVNGHPTSIAVTIDDLGCSRGTCAASTVPRPASCTPPAAPSWCGTPPRGGSRPCSSRRAATPEPAAPRGEPAQVAPLAGRPLRVHHTALPTTSSNHPYGLNQRIVWALVAVVMLVGVATAVHRAPVIHSGPAVDFDINWVATKRLVDRAPLYDRIASRHEAVQLLGPRMEASYRDSYSSYIGTPVVALLHAPLLAFGHRDALALFRGLNAFAMLIAIALTASLVSLGSRLLAFCAGTAVLLLSWPLIVTLGIGQGNGVVMLGLALGIWGAARGRWGVCGLGFGVATALKVTPGLALAYLAWRGEWRALRSGVATVLGLSAIAALVGRPADLATWLTHVLTSASSGTPFYANQSFSALVERAVTSHTDLFQAATIGAARYLAIAVVLTALGALWRMRRHAPIVPIELGVLILVTLVAGPLSWYHYFVWAAIPVVLLCEPQLWHGVSTRTRTALLVLLVAAVTLLATPLDMPAADRVASNWWTRVTTSPYVFAAFILAAVGFVLLRPSRRGASARPALPS